MPASARPQAAEAWAAALAACRLGFQRSPFRFTSLRAPAGASCEPLDRPDTNPVTERPACGGQVAAAPTGESAASSVDLLEFAFRPLHDVLRGAALHRLGVHVGDDVFGQRFGWLLARR